MKKDCKSRGLYVPDIWYQVRKIFIIMKLSLLILLVSLLSAGASVYSQTSRLNLNYKNVSLKEVLGAIEDQSEFRFAFSSEYLDLDRKVSVRFDNESVTTILDNIFKETGIRYSVKERMIILYKDETGGNEALQQKTVTGKVTDSSGQPLPGVSVVVKGTTTGTITDFDGKYTLANVPGDAALVFSFVGMRAQEINVTGKTNVNITMQEETIGVDEVVVVAYGVQKKAHLTAAIDQVDASMMENRPVKSVSEALQSVVPGLNVSVVSGAPQHDLKLNIRGYTGFGAEGSPLILVDGVERTLSDINPADVESVTVLKDAAASAIYGSRAPFGVILITTKSGKKDQPVQVNYSGDVAFGSPVWMPEMVDSWLHAERFNAFYRNGLQAPQFKDDAIQRMKDYASGVIDYNNIELNNGLWGGHFVTNDNIDWFKQTTRNVIPSQRHNLNFSGGSGNTTYYMGLGYNESVGIFNGIGDNKDRYTALLKVNTDVKSWLSLNFSMNYVKTDEKGPSYNTEGRNYSTIFNWISRTWPSWPVYHPNGSPYVSSIYESLTGKTGMEKVIRGDLNIAGGFRVTPLKGWDITGQYTTSFLNSRYEKTSFPLIGYNPNGTMYWSARATRQAQLERQMADRNFQTINLFSSYTKEYKNHSFHILAGYQQESELYYNVRGHRLDLFTTEIPSLTLGTGPIQLSDNIEQWATQGYFGRFSYNYEGKYMFEFNGRYDAHSKFPKNIRWAFFPSFSGAWNIAKESFWPTSLVTSFKVRASHTSSGDHGSGNYLYLAPMGTGVGGSNDVILEGAKPIMVFTPALVSDQLTWAKPRTIDVGMDIEAFGKRLEMTYDWYQRTIFDQAGPAEPLPQTLGTTPPKKNNAVSETRGWEVSAKWRDKGFAINGSRFNYSVGLRLSDYIGYVVEYEDNITGTRSSWTPGQIFGKNYFYESAGIAQNIADVEKNVPQGSDWYYPGDLMMKDLNGDGKIDGGEGNYWYSMGDQVNGGYNYPRYRYGITFEADWKGLDLSVLMEGVGHWKIYSGSDWLFGANNQWSGGWFREHEELGTWSPETPNAFYPRKIFNTTYGALSKNNARANDQYAVNLAHLKIRNVRLGYNLPKNLISKIDLKRVYVYTSIENLGYIFYKSWIKYDPEIIDSYNGQGYPTQRVISFGINLTL
ncbi:MAG: TonB-dependent receptor [Prolixibacteraceae bacterium]|jgi:TonB-linked SusC/RagA family outer membrane protein|nr:TonB-dependent receptor [Prolixibacteraceae bacterium]